MKTRTQPIYGLVIFAGIAVVVSIGAIILFSIDMSNLFISILVFIFGGLFSIGGIAVIIDQLTHYVEVKENDLINHVFLAKHVLPISEIRKIKNNKEIYEVYSKKGKFCTIPSHLKGVDTIMFALSRRGVEITEKSK